MLNRKYCTRSVPLPTPNHSFKTCSGHEAIASTATFNKCGAKTSSQRQKRYILITHLETCFFNSIYIYSAFDMIDHYILEHHLHTDFGFTYTVLQWISSYLTNRSQYVSLSNHWSAFAPVHSSVPQDSVLGPILFTMYAKPLPDIIDLNIHHSFSNDSHITFTTLFSQHIILVTALKQLF